ncbi:RDD family protein [Streptomyces benahoarensis]|nr:RDD family protein [Streptomyces benahoarensis]TSB10622.1 RDD family protein [Streptomyces benahoarensis]
MYKREETGPVFLDEGSGTPAAGGGSPLSWDDPARLHGSGPAPASAWQADATQQGGTGAAGPVSWGASDASSGTPSVTGETRGAIPSPRERGDADAESGAAASGQRGEEPEPPSRRDGTVAIRAVRPPARDQGTTTIRAVRPGDGPAPKDGGTMAIRLPRRPGPAAGQGGAAGSAPAAGQGGPGGPAAPAPSGPQSMPGAGASGPAYPPHPQHPHPRQAPFNPPQAPAAPGPVPPQAVPQPGPAAGGGFPFPGGAGPAGGSAGDDGVIPWKPPTADPFATEQAHPAALGRRLAARLIDLALLAVLTVLVALPLWGGAMDHVDAKITAAKESGREVTVYLLDGGTAPLFLAMLAAVVLGGGLIELLPTLKWGRSLGKKLCGVRVVDIESHDTPELMSLIKRWLVFGVLGFLVVGVLDAAWCLFDKPWRQCWHDKVARTFVAAD